MEIFLNLFIIQNLLLWDMLFESWYLSFLAGSHESNSSVSVSIVIPPWCSPSSLLKHQLFSELKVNLQIQQEIVNLECDFRGKKLPSKLLKYILLPIEDQEVC